MDPVQTKRPVLQPQFEYVMSIRVKLAPKLAWGELPQGGDRYFVEILEGDFEGPGIRGTVLPGGGDWAHVRPDGTLDFDARYNLRTDDGTLIVLHNRGFRWAPADVMARLARREPADPSEYYMRVAPRFDVPKGRHEWMARHVFVGIGDKIPEGNVIHYYKLL